MDIPPRYSLRLRKKQRDVSPQVVTALATQTKKQQTSHTSESKPSPSKRRKISQETGVHIEQGPVILRPDGRVKGRRGHLQFMTEMPMDVLYEILISLDPIDLLHLSWASKALHSIVMGKPSRHIWEAAFKDLYTSPHPPPPCPSDLNPAQYARLLFDKRCMECNSPHGSHVVWPHRLRVCANCLEGDRFTALTSPYRFWSVVPIMRTFVHGRYQTFVLASEFNELKAKMDSMNSNSEEYRTFMKERGKWVSARRQDEWKFAQWQREQKRGRKNELEEMRIKRRDLIVHKLTELGWGAELELLNEHQLWTFPGMRVAKPLTDRAWEALCPELIDHLEAVQALRLEQEKQDRVARRGDDLAQKIVTWSMDKSQLDALPQVLDFALSEPFKSMLLNEADEELKLNDLELFGEFDRFLENWNGLRDQFLISLTPFSSQASESDAKGKGKAKASPTVLDLATTFFQCPGCTEPISYPRVLAHECLHTFSVQSNRRDADPEHLAMLSNGSHYRPWLCDAQDLIFDQEASSIAKMVVKECGENPDEATAERMDELDCRLECLRCAEPKKGRLVMKWRMAILHDLGRHPNAPPTPSRRGKKKATQPVSEARWKVITDADDIALIRAKEEKAQVARTLACKQCPGSSILPDLESMQDHWTFYHSHQFSSRILSEIDLPMPPPQNLPLPEEAELRAMFEQRLDQSIKSTHSTIKIPN
ncbi:hypothetical protein D9756_001346 [Leucocoprinus leucothites]|uniref:F-box domain-containing protein n=1 Tax=Leucocoprinus leucothites TaxID=201217 RepID=A0A8H5G528_9AGAR|nr:hypothetical protein D9756_001346 [Leucoagaricus leucothites]